MNSLVRIGLVKENASLDDVLNLSVNDLLARRLQTFVQKKFSFKTPYQARQAITHGHIMIEDRIIDVPSYIVSIKEEEEIHLAPKSTLKNLLQAKPAEAEPEPVAQEPES